MQFTLLATWMSSMKSSRWYRPRSQEAMEVQCPSMGMAGFEEKAKDTATELGAEESIIASESADAWRYKDATKQEVARRDPDRSSIGIDIGQCFRGERDNTPKSSERLEEEGVHPRWLRG